MRCGIVDMGRAPSGPITGSRPRLHTPRRELSTDYTRVKGRLEIVPGAATRTRLYTSPGQKLRLHKSLEVERDQGLDRRPVLPLDTRQALLDRRLETGEVLVVTAGQAFL